ncbi:MAG: PEP-utilizing enzyme [Micrococcales bacterium]|nr:PEP-utilizing enzyme [Micrococcales bacterium]
MTLRRLGDGSSTDLVGSKAHNLGRLIEAGLPVPEGWVVDTSSPDLSADLVAEIADLPDGTYAVRSSGQQEDLADLSFAGQYTTVLDVARADLVEAVRCCLDSVDSAAATAYRERHGLAAGAMAVIIQRLVPAETSGVAFTLDPVTGADTHLVVEYTPGLGESLVNGQVVPRSARYDWFDQRWLEPEHGPEHGWLDQLADLCLAAQRLFGHPLDIEFAYADGQVWLLQARAVTRITYTGLDDTWTTADFKDGGVSAQTCKPFMWSLYEYVWESSLKDFLLTSHLIKPDRLRPLGRMSYGRPYWNLSVVKEIMSRVPGYSERAFDTEFGITPTYTGDGQVTRLTPRTLAGTAVVAAKQRRLLAQREAQAPALAARVRDTVARRLDQLDGPRTSPWLRQAFVELTRDDYLFSESTYFWQIFLNTIHQSLFRDAIAAYVDDEGYLALLSGLDDISHLRPFQDLWRISRQDETSYAAELAQHLQTFGYHSDKELDVSYPSYWERPQTVADQLRQIAALDASHDPALTHARQQALFADQMDRLRGAVPRRRLARLERKVTRVRQLLWWREEFRDLSTMMYDVIRRYTLALGQDLVDHGTLDEVDDIWFTTVSDLWDFLEASAPAGPDGLRQIVVRRRRYYDAYRNFLSENEIGPVPARARPADGLDLHGIGCSSGKVTGRARVIDSPDQIGRIADGDVLVTRFTDTGWTAKFALLRGVVTEYGGMLCHAAIVSREYGIPCVVGVDGVLGAVRDGQEITVDGGAGTVTVVS